MFVDANFIFYFFFRNKIDNKLAANQKTKQIAVQYGTCICILANIKINISALIATKNND